MEIVSRPDMRSAEEVGAYVTKLRSILRFLGTCDGNMEQGSLRADCNAQRAARAKRSARGQKPEPQFDPLYSAGDQFWCPPD